ncbi:MAG: thioredoxin family protein [Candidatus Kapaibacterium sp.]|nr:MAG: thioredoxin family protein [Candidatus Kapabacteria bacterium]
MAATPSRMMPLGTIAPNFSLPDTQAHSLGRFISLEDLRSKHATVVMFLCNHCPYVLHLTSALVRCVEDYSPQGISFVGISSNDAVQYPDDAPHKMTLHAKAHGYTFPYLYDASQDVARAYDAACTPDFFIFDKDLRCVYRGQFDDSRPKNTIAPTGNDLRAALEAILAGMPPNPDQKPSIGCNIKWKS